MARGATVEATPLALKAPSSAAGLSSTWPALRYGISRADAMIAVGLTAGKPPGNRSRAVGPPPGRQERRLGLSPSFGLRGRAIRPVGTSCAGHFAVEPP